MEQSVLSTEERRSVLSAEEQRWVNAIVKLTSLTYKNKLRWSKAAEPPASAVAWPSPSLSRDQMPVGFLAQGALDQKRPLATYQTTFEGNTFYLAAYLPVFALRLALPQLTSNDSLAFSLRVLAPTGDVLAEFPHLSVLRGLYDAVISQFPEPQEAVLKSIEDAED